MRIQISGAHGTGKTTLAKKLAELLHMPYVSCDPVQYMRERRVETPPSRWTRQIQTDFLEWQLWRMRLYDNVVFDRGIEDGVTYAILMGFIDWDEATKYLNRRPEAFVILLTKPIVERDFPIEAEVVTRMMRQVLRRSTRVVWYEVRGRCR